MSNTDIDEIKKKQVGDIFYHDERKTERYFIDLFAIFIEKYNKLQRVINYGAFVRDLW